MAARSAAKRSAGHAPFSQRNSVIEQWASRLGTSACARRRLDSRGRGTLLSWPIATGQNGQGRAGQRNPRRVRMAAIPEVTSSLRLLGEEASKAGFEIFG